MQKLLLQKIYRNVVFKNKSKVYFNTILKYIRNTYIHE